jgi:CheY-like chemotaxis protein
MSTGKPRVGKRRSPGRAPGRRTILIVDDEQGTVDVLTAVLKDAGYEAIGAANGRDALGKLRGGTVSAVLLDVMMPVLDGPATLRALRGELGLSELPVVLMSGIPESMVKRRCRGYTAFLRKPFSLDELLATLQRVLRARG